ncbi:protease inhibitor I42 family protein [Deinococcus multiflagellatus]|uniref:Protease inhibitor I42 family protein n=1 Tax=Deinococcus multiflagellatus TaxID=1656887 RepID=A0ABW1ZGM2_9DEIO|nr:protease inhibitor I42 family protein [Deinococcus multiflagellatus]MBZ9712128.1 protease inhibitor I42 family protein [Deinococcus multiflagellatus]
MTIRNILLGGAAALTLGVSAGPAAAPRTLSFNVGAAGQEIAVQPGDRLRFSLNSAAGTGYMWRALEVDPAYLALVDKRTVAPAPAAGSAPVVGGAGPVTVYTYQVVAPLRRGGAALTTPIYFAELPPGRATTVETTLIQFNLVPR